MEHCYASSIDANGKPHRCMLEVHHSGDHQFPCGAAAPSGGFTCTLAKGHLEMHRNSTMTTAWPTDEQNEKWKAEAAAEQKSLTQEVREVIETAIHETNTLPLRHNAGTCVRDQDCVLADGHPGPCEHLPSWKPKRQYSHYFKDVSKLDVIDVYRVLVLWEVTDPCIQHALKKLLCAGQRGAKDVTKDIKEVIVSCERFLEMQTENENKRS